MKIEKKKGFFFYGIPTKFQYSCALINKIVLKHEQNTSLKVGPIFYFFSKILIHICRILMSVFFKIPF